MQNITEDTINITANIAGAGVLTVAVPIPALEEAPEFIDLEGALEAAKQAVLTAYEALTGEADAYDPDPDAITEADLWATVEAIEDGWRAAPAVVNLSDYRPAPAAEVA